MHIPGLEDPLASNQLPCCVGKHVPGHSAAQGQKPRPAPVLPHPHLSLPPSALQATAHTQSSFPEPSISPVTYSMGDGRKTNKYLWGAKKNSSPILLFPPGLITWLSKCPVLTSHPMHTHPGGPKGPSPPQGTPPNPSGKPGCFLTAPKGSHAPGPSGELRAKPSPTASLRCQVKD